MNVFVVYDGYEPVKVCWTKKQAVKEAYPDCVIKPIELASISDLVDRYFQFRTYQEPSAEEAFLFLMSELGELAEAFQTSGTVDPEETIILSRMVDLGRYADNFVSNRKGWVRNGDRQRAPSTPDEIGDVLMMLTKFSSTLNRDPIKCMEAKMHSKGFTK